jgi:hypothetical protein
VIEGGTISAGDTIARGAAGLCSSSGAINVIASEAKQSILSYAARWIAFASLAMTRKDRSATTTVIPATAGIQYAAAYRFITDVSGILDQPAFAGDDD